MLQINIQVHTKTESIIKLRISITYTQDNDIHKIMSGNNQTHENRNIRGSPQPWGYIHQKVSPACDIYFIKRLQSATQNVAILFYRTIAGSSIGSISPKFIPYKTFVNVHGITDMILTYYCYNSISFTRLSFDNEIHTGGFMSFLVYTTSLYSQ